MEIICVDKQTFEELRVRFCDSHQQEDTTGISQQRDIAFQPYQEQAVLQA